MLRRQFKALMEMLRSQLAAIEKAIDEQTHANREGNKASEAQWSKVPGIITNAIRPAQHEVADTQARYDQTYRQQERALGIQRRLIKATWWTFGAAFLAAAGAWYYARIADRQLRAEMRPWISLDGKGIAVIKPLDYARDRNGSIIGVKLYLEHHFQNTGRTPAFIAPYGRLYDYRPDSQTFPTKIANICDTAEYVTRRNNTLPDDNGTIPWTWMVLPGVPMASHISYDGVYEDKPMTLSPKSIEKGEFIIFNLGCVIYRTEDDRTIHHTGWMAEISLCNPSGIAVQDDEIPIKIRDEPIAPENLCVNHVYLVGKAD